MGQASVGANERRRVRAEDLRIAAPLVGWSEAALERLAAASSQRWHEAGEILERAWEPPTGLWIVVEGCVELSRTSPSGRRHLVDLLAPPQVAGLIPLLDGREALFDAVARVRSWLIWCPCKAVTDELQADAAAALGTIRALCFRQRMEHDRVAMNAFDPLLARVCKTIMYLGRRPGMLEGREQALPVPVTYEDLADFLDQSPSAVVRVIRTLIKAGAVEKHYRGVVIADMGRLSAIAQNPNPINSIARDYLDKGERI